MLKWIGIIGLVFAGIMVSKLPVSLWTDAGECGGKIVSWAGEKVTGGFAWVANRVRDEERQDAAMYADAVKDRIAPVIAGESQRVVDAVTQSSTAMADIASRQTQILGGLSQQQTAAMAEARSDHRMMVRDLAQLQADVVDVRHDLDAREIDSIVWVLTKDGTFRQYRLAPAQQNTEPSGSAIDDRDNDSEAIRIDSWRF